MGGEGRGCQLSEGRLVGLMQKFTKQKKKQLKFIAVILQNGALNFISCSMQFGIKSHSSL